MDLIDVEKVRGRIRTSHLLAYLLLINKARFGLVLRLREVINVSLSEKRCLCTLKSSTDDRCILKVLPIRPL